MHANRKHGHLQIQETEDLFDQICHRKASRTKHSSFMHLYCWEKSIKKKKNHQNLNSLQIRQKLNTNFGTAFNSPLKYRVLAEKKKQQQKTCLLVTESYEYWKVKISGETTKLYQLTITTLGPQKHNWEQNIVTWMLEDDQMNKSLFTNQ